MDTNFKSQSLKTKQTIHNLPLSVNSFFATDKYHTLQFLKTMSVTNLNLSNPMSINIFTNFKTSFKTIFTSIILTFCFSITFGQSLPVPQQVLTEKRVRETLKENAATIRFMENKGQYPNKDVLYYCESKKGSIYIEKSKIRFVTSEYITKKKVKK
ncbi:MAG: hypothetical protein IPL31_09105 [Saprospiraceae bacterium]|nr:hypothetical protein [Saprospiraceae bacterium]